MRRFTLAVTFAFVNFLTFLVVFLATADTLKMISEAQSLVVEENDMVECQGIFEIELYGPPSCFLSDDSISQPKKLLANAVFGKYQGESIQ